MSEDRIQRRLAAILAMDLVGYSRLMDANEVDTLSRLKSVRAEVIEPGLAAHGGRLFKTTGDGFLAEFGSVVDAVTCAVEVQRTVAAREPNLPRSDRLRFRAGINLGDIVVEGDDLYGGGVNLAARLEQLAEPGGLCVADAVRESVRGRVDVEFEDQGEQALKNIDAPVRVWQWPGREPLSSDRSYPAGQPAKPSIVVMPFDDLSGGENSDGFCDALTEDLITALSRLIGFLVIGRGTTFAYKERRVGLKQIADELGVDYVLEGSLRQAGDRIRINAQLGETGKGSQLWAAHFEGSVTDVFTLQDQITRRIVASVQPELIKVLAGNDSTTAPRNIEAWVEIARGRRAFWRWERHSMAEAEVHVRRAIDLDPGYAEAHALLSLIRWGQAISGFTEDSGSTLEDAAREAGVAVAHDETSAFGHVALAIALLSAQDHQGAIAEAERAVELQPGQSDILVLAAYPLVYGGEEEQALAWAQESLELNPRDPQVYGRHQLIATAQFALGRYDEALTNAERVVRLQPDWLEGRTIAIASLVCLGRLKEGTEQLQQAVAKNPAYSPDYAVRRHPFHNRETRQRLHDALLAASGISDQDVRADPQ